MTRNLLFILLVELFVSGFGLYSSCDICSGLNVTNPSMVVNMLYLGVVSCKNLYENGIKGNIPTHLCDPLKYYCREPCGCRNTTLYPIQPVKYTVKIITNKDNKQ